MALNPTGRFGWFFCSRLLRFFLSNGLCQSRLFLRCRGRQSRFFSLASTEVCRFECRHGSPDLGYRDGSKRKEKENANGNDKENHVDKWYIHKDHDGSKAYNGDKKNQPADTVFHTLHPCSGHAATYVRQRLGAEEETHH